MKAHRTFFISKLIAFFGIALVLTACHSLAPEPSSSKVMAPVVATTQTNTQYPIAQGNIWVYSYSAYQATPANPLQTMTVTYLITETVTNADLFGAQIVATIERKEALVEAPSDWITETATLFDDSWLVISGTQIFGSLQPIELSNLLNEGWLLYEFPLTVGKSWCPYQQSAMPKPIDCDGFGKQTVTQHSAYDTPAGHFEDCFEIVETVTSGGRHLGFCPDIGIAKEWYDHGGSKFGYEKVLADYSIVPESISTTKESSHLTPPLAEWPTYRHEGLGVALHYPVGWQPFDETSAFIRFGDSDIQPRSEAFNLVQANLPVHSMTDFTLFFSLPILITRTITLDNQPALFIQIKPGEHDQGYKSVVFVIGPDQQMLTLGNRSVEPALFEQILSTIRFFKPKLPL